MEEERTNNERLTRLETNVESLEKKLTSIEDMIRQALKPQSPIHSHEQSQQPLPRVEQNRPGQQHTPPMPPQQGQHAQQPHRPPMPPQQGQHAQQPHRPPMPPQQGQQAQHLHNQPLPPQQGQQAHYAHTSPMPPHQGQQAQQPHRPPMPPQQGQQAQYAGQPYTGQHGVPPFTHAGQSASYMPPRPQTKTSDFAWDRFIFQKLLPRLFMFVLILGILWGFKAASDYGYITDPVKVMLGFITAALLLVYGIIQFRNKRHILGQVLIGGSIPIFMLTTFAMHQLYDLSGPTLALILNIIWILIGVYFTDRYKSEGLGAVTVLGGLLVPFLIKSTGEPNIAVFIIYETIFYVLFIGIALKNRFIYLYYGSAALLNIVLIIFYTQVTVPNHLLLLTITPLLFQQLALLVGFLTTRYKLVHQAYVLFSSVLLSSLWVGVVLSDLESSLVFAGVALVHGVLFTIYRKDSLRAPIMIASALMSLLFLVLTIYDELGIEVLLGSSLIYLYLSQQYKSVLHRVLSIASYVVGTLLIIDQPIEHLISWEMLHWLVLVILTGFGIYYVNKITGKQQWILNLSLIYYALLLMGFAVALVSSLGDHREITSILWIIIAIGFMVMSGLTSIQQGKYIGAGILCFTVIKIILYDIHYLSIGLRALIFIILGLVGLIVSRIYYKKVE